MQCSETTANRHTNVKYEGDKAIINVKGIEDSISHVLSAGDIKATSNTIWGMRNKQGLMSLLFSRKGCNEKDGKCFYDKGLNKCVPYGNFSSKVVFIRKMPTEVEQAAMLSHSDSYAYILMTALGKLGFSPDDFYFTDFMKCYGGEKINGSACVNCMSAFLLKELDFLKPELIIAEGSEVMHALNSRIFESRVNVVPGKVEVTSIFNGRLVKTAAIYDTALMVNEKDPVKLQEKKNGLWVQLNNILSEYRKG